MRFRTIATIVLACILGAASAGAQQPQPQVNLEPLRGEWIGKVDALASATDPGMRGFRISFSLPRWAEALEAQRVDWLWRAAAEAQVRIALMVSQAQLPLIDKVAARFPDLKVVICHLALPTEDKDEAAFRDFDLILPLAKRSNVMVKVSALPAYTSAPYPFAPLLPYVRKIYDAFGPRRMFWGTDLARMPCSYAQAIRFFTEEIPFLTEDDKHWIMGRGFCEWLN